MKVLLTILLFCAVAAAQQQPGEPQIIAVNSAPAAGTQGSASVAAITDKRHVLYKVCFSAAATTAPVATQLDVNLRDGASGAGTVKASFRTVVTATTGTLVGPFCTGELNIRGTTNTAMTAEWSASLANLFQQITLYYYDIGAGTN